MALPDHQTRFDLGGYTKGGASSFATDPSHRHLRSGLLHRAPRHPCRTAQARTAEWHTKVESQRAFIDGRRAATQCARFRSRRAFLLDDSRGGQDMRENAAAFVLQKWCSRAFRSRHDGMSHGTTSRNACSHGICAGTYALSPSAYGRNLSSCPRIRHTRGARWRARVPQRSTARSPLPSLVLPADTPKWELPGRAACAAEMHFRTPPLCEAF